MIFSAGIDKLKKSFGSKPGKGDTRRMPERPRESRGDGAGPPEGGGTKSMGRERIKIDLLIHDLKVPIAVIEEGGRLAGYIRNTTIIESMIQNGAEGEEDPHDA